MISVLAFVALASQDNLLDYALRQWQREPEMRIEDAYKWLFHATLGGEHAVLDDSGPRQWLDNEWPTLTPPKPDEREVVPLRPDGKVIRVNLRPYRQRGGDKEMILAVFVSSARQFHADKREFVREWDRLGEYLAHFAPLREASGKLSRRGKVRQGLRHLCQGDWLRLDHETRLRRFPAIDHSVEYERAAHPAYRVILGSLWLPTNGKGSP